MHAADTTLDRLVAPDADHVLGAPDASATLLEYGSYTCPSCHTVHPVVAALRDRFGHDLRYAFRHRPTPHPYSRYAAEIAEVVWLTTGRFWPIHDALMRGGPAYTKEELDAIAAEFGVSFASEDVWTRARARVEADIASSRHSGATVSPTFFIGSRRYEGPWDETTLAEALVRSLGHRLDTAALDLVRWGPATGLLLLMASIIAVAFSNSPLAAWFASLWQTPTGLTWGAAAFVHPVFHWVNHGLLTLFFLVVGLEIKREFTVGRLATRRAAALPVAGAIGGMLVPAVLYSLLAGAPGTGHGWGIPIATDTAFAIAIIVLLGARVPVELRVFLTAAVIVDDLAAIAVVALFYTERIDPLALAGAAAMIGLMWALNRFGVYRALAYAVLGVLLWLCLHASGVHATLAGVVLALATPTRPPANLDALLAQAQLLLRGERALDDEKVLHTRPSDAAMRKLDAIYDRVESPADKLLRTIEPWSSFVVLPLFALANAGVVLSIDALAGHGALFAGIMAGLVVGKPLGIVLFAALAVRLGIAEKPEAYSWWQLLGAGALGGIGFTMSLFIAELAFTDVEVFSAAKLAIFAASLLAGVIGALILWLSAAPARPSSAPS